MGGGLRARSAAKKRGKQPRFSGCHPRTVLSAATKRAASST